jgi:uncharacterized protein
MGHAARAYSGCVRTMLRWLAIVWVPILGAGVMTGAAWAAGETDGTPTAQPTSGQGPGSVTLSAVEEADYALSAVVPDGWTDQGSGVYTRSTSASDPGDRTLLVLQSAPIPAASLWPTLEKQLGLEAVPDPVGTRDTSALQWTLYHLEVPAPTGVVAVDLGLAESGGRTWIAMLQTSTAESARLHDEVLLPVLDAYAPLTNPSPSPGTRPYDEQDVTFAGGADGVTLAGTLTLPHGDGPHPAIVLLSGSGPQDRDETLLPVAQMKPFALIADALGRAGVAVLRFDDRGVGHSTGDFASATTSDFTADARAAVAYLRSRPEVDPARVGALGHSEGGLEVAAMAAADPSLAFVVAMAGPAVPGVEVLVAQSEAIARAAGKSEHEVAQTGKLERTVLEAVRDGRTDEARASLVTALGEAWDGLTADEQRQAGTRDSYVQANAETQLQALQSPWVTEFLQTDPGADWREARVPILALYGGKDVQVLAEQNAPALAEELATDARSLSAIVIIPDANHLFQHAITGAPGEYGSLEQVFTPDFLPTLVDWVTAHSTASG